MKSLRNIFVLHRNGYGVAKYILMASLVVLLIPAINLSDLVNNLDFPLFVYPILWGIWMAIYLGSTSPKSKFTMQVAWIILVIAVLLSLLEQVFSNTWSTTRRYVIMQDLTVFALAPFSFPAGIIPELLGNAIELIPFVGNGVVHRFEISHGLGIFVVLTWAKYCCATLFETWVILNVADRYCRARQLHKENGILK